MSNSDEKNPLVTLSIQAHEACQSHNLDWRACILSVMGQKPKTERQALQQFIGRVFIVTMSEPGTPRKEAISAMLQSTKVYLAYQDRTLADAYAIWDEDRATFALDTLIGAIGYTAYCMEYIDTD